ncbi:uncharacterized protein METZ01_LOCUS58343 [marine metagenome]|uniref:DUF998 domain-containing protein n=1 Tax=marine metagenome TaxID=408172 RepID=A0A381SPT4_9ZZZZ
MRYFWTVKVIRFIPILFTIGILISMYLYPGGNIHDPLQTGYSFTHNFLSDLGGMNSRSGESNIVSSYIFNACMISFFLGGIAFLYVPGLFKNDRTNYYLAIIGSMFFFLGASFFAGVGLTPHDLYLDQHIFFAINGFRLMVPAGIFYLVVLLRSPIKKSYSLVTLFFLLSTFSYVLYQLLADSPLISMEAMIMQAIMQKLITFVHLLSIFSLSFAFSSQQNLAETIN